MPVYQLDENDYIFPDISHAEPDGLLAVGGDLSPKRLLYAYINGIFPWFSQKPILWWSPDPRMILLPSKFHCSKSLKRIIKSNKFEIRFDTVFGRVVEECSSVFRADQGGTWITSDMKKAYKELFKLGFAHSVEVFHANRLVGGLYGVSIGACFFGESMFHKETDASKVAFYFLCKWMEMNKFGLIDCQMHTSHLESLGAELIPRAEYLNHLQQYLYSKDTMIGKWIF